MSSPVVFLDKDGTIVKDEPYSVDIHKLRFQNGAIQGLRDLYAAGFRLVIVSNQSGIARGFFRETDLQAYAAYLSDRLRQEAGVVLEGFYYCPHHPEGTAAGYTFECDCRKPKPGLLYQAARELDIDLAESWMVGDILNDVEAGNQAGCTTILINNGDETEWLPGPYRDPDFTAANLEEAAQMILSAQKPEDDPVQRCDPDSTETEPEISASAGHKEQ